MERTYGFGFHEVQGLWFALVDDALGPRMVAPAFGDYAERHAGDGMPARIEAARAAFPGASFTIKVAGGRELPEERRIRSSLLHEIEPTAGLDQARPSFRRLVAQAQRAGLAVRTRRDHDALVEFYRLYASQRIHKFRALPQPFGFFKNVADAFFGDDGFLIEVHLGGQPAAFVMALRHEQVLYYKFGASDPDALAMRPNNLAMAALVERARDMGMERLDLGLTPREGGLAAFKRGLGARELPLGTYRWPALDGGDQDVAGKRVLLTEATRALVSSDPGPDAASAMGAAFYRYFV
jgi:hypothetical protein